jgi:ribosome biogenesis protein Nip4
MRPLTEDETRTLFLKLSEYIGKNVEKLINRTDERYCFRLMNHDRCYYISESLMKAANSISRDNLLSVGTCIGKFTKSGKFRLHITALEYLSQYAKVRLPKTETELSEQTDRQKEMGERAETIDTRLNKGQCSVIWSCASPSLFL